MIEEVSVEINLSAEVDVEIEKEYFQATTEIFDQLEIFLKSKSYGSDVEMFVPILRVMDSNFVKDFIGDNKVRKYSKKHKTIIVVSELDFLAFRDGTDDERKSMAAYGILAAINESDSMRVKPKDWNKNLFYEDIMGLFRRNKWI